MPVHDCIVNTVCVTDRLSPKGIYYQFLYVCTASQIYFISDEKKFSVRKNKIPSRTIENLQMLGRKEVRMYNNMKYIDVKKKEKGTVVGVKSGCFDVEERTQLMYLLSSR
jgi:hypothetical protein